MLQSPVCFMPSQMTREGILVEILQKGHSEAGRYVQLVQGFVGEGDHTIKEIFHDAEGGSGINDDLSIVYHLLIQGLAFRVLLLRLP